MALLLHGFRNISCSPRSSWSEAEAASCFSAILFIGSSLITVNFWRACAVDRSIEFLYGVNCRFRSFLVRGRSILFLFTLPKISQSVVTLLQLKLCTALQFVLHVSQISCMLTEEQGLLWLMTDNKCKALSGEPKSHDAKQNKTLLAANKQNYISANYFGISQTLLQQMQPSNS